MKNDFLFKVYNLSELSKAWSVRKKINMDKEREEENKLNKIFPYFNDFIRQRKINQVN